MDSALQNIVKRITSTRDTTDRSIAKAGKNPDSSKRYLKSVTDMLKREDAKLESHPDGQKFKGEMNEWVKSANERIAAIQRLADLDKITRQIDGSLRWLKSAVKSGDVAKINKYCTEIATKLEAANEQLSATPDGQKYIVDANAQCEQAKLAGAQAALVAEAKKIIQKAKSNLSWAKSYTKNDPNKALTYFKKCKEIIAPFLTPESQFSPLDVVKAFMKDFIPLQQQLEGSAEEAKVKQEIDGDMRPISGQLRWMKTYMSQGDVKKIRDYCQAGLTAVKNFQLKWASEESTHKFMNDTRTEFINGMEKAGQMQLANELDAEMRKLTTELKWMESYFKSQKPKVVGDKLNAFIPGFQAFCNKYGAIPTATQFVNSTKATVTMYQKEIPIMIGTQKAQGIIRSLEQSKKWLENSLKNSDPEGAMKYRAEFEEKIKPLYALSTAKEAADYIAEAKILLDNVEKDLGELVFKLEMDRAIKGAKSPLTWLGNSLDRKDDVSASKYLKELRVLVAPIQRYGDKPQAAAFLAQVATMEKRVEDELGEIIARKQMAPILRSAHSTLKWAESALKAKNVQSVQTYTPQIESKITELSSFTKYTEAAESVATLKAFLDSVDENLGPIIAEIEITSLGRRIKSPTGGLKNAISTKNLKSAVGYRMRVLEAVAPLKSKYSENPLAKPIIAEATAVLNDCELKLGGLLAAEEIKSAATKINNFANLGLTSAMNGDKRATLSYMQKTFLYLHPIRVQFFYHPDAKALVKKADDLKSAADDAGVELSAFHTKDMAELQQTLTSAMSGTPPTGRDLELLNQGAVKQLKMNYGFVPAVIEALTKLDKYNISVYGRIPPMETEYLPVFQVSWKLDQKLQDGLRGINEVSAAVNPILNGALKAFEDMDSSGASLGTLVPYKSFQYEFARIEKELAKIGKHIQTVSTIAPDHASIQMTQDGLENIKATMTEWKATWPVVCTYVQYACKLFLLNLEYQHLLKSCQEIANQPVSHSTSANPYKGLGYDNLWSPTRSVGAVYDMYPAMKNVCTIGMDLATKAMGLLAPDQTVDAENFLNTFTAGVEFAEKAHNDVVIKWGIGLYKIDEKYYSEICVKSCCGDDGNPLPEYKIGYNIVASYIKAEKDREEEERKAAAAARAKAHEEARQRKIKQFNDELAIWVTPYPSGEFTCNAGKFTWKGNELTCVSGALAGSKGKLEGSEKTGQLHMYMGPYDLVVGTSDDVSGQTDIYSHREGFLFGYKRLSSDMVFQATFNDALKYTVAGSAMNLSTAYKGLTTKVSFTGKVPPPIMVFMASLERVITRTAERLQIRKERWIVEQSVEVRTKAWKDWLESIALKSCGPCHTSGANIYQCRECGKSWCSYCRTGYSGANVCSCGSYGASSASSVWMASVPYQVDLKKQFPLSGKTLDFEGESVPIDP